MSRSNRDKDAYYRSVSPVDQPVQPRDTTPPRDRRDRSRSPRRDRSRTPPSRDRRDRSRSPRRDRRDRSRSPRRDRRDRSRSPRRDRRDRKRDTDRRHDRDSDGEYSHGSDDTKQKPGTKEQSPPPDGTITDKDDVVVDMIEEEEDKIYTEKVPRSYFKHNEKTTREQMDMINDAIIKANPTTSYEANRRKGYTLEWASMKTHKKDVGSAKQLYLRWIDKNGKVPSEHVVVEGKKKREMVPQLELVYPAGPATGFRFTLASLEDKYEKKADAIDQHVYLSDVNPDKDSEDYHVHERYYIVIAELNEIFYEKYAAYMGNMSNHTYLPEEEREEHRNDPVHAGQWILGILRDPNNNKFREPKHLSPSHHFTKKPKNPKQTGLTKRSRAILAQMSNHTIKEENRHYKTVALLKPSNVDINPISVMLCDGTRVDLRDIHLLHGSSAILSVSVCFWGIYQRQDGDVIQYGVIIRCQQVQIYNNGEEQYGVHSKAAHCPNVYGIPEIEDTKKTAPKETTTPNVNSTVQETQKEASEPKQNSTVPDTPKREDKEPETRPDAKRPQEKLDTGEKKKRRHRHTKRTAVATDDDDGIFDNIEIPAPV